jgi:rhodanese-related sulfurtransferase
MRKKIIGAIVILLLTATSISVMGEMNTQDKTIIDNNIIEQKSLENDISMNLYQGDIFVGVKLDIKNNGVDPVDNVEWSFRYKAVIKGTGVFIVSRLQNGVIDEIQPGETKTLTFTPFDFQAKSPIGLGNIYLNASVLIDGEETRTQQRAFLLGIFLIMYKDTYMDISPKVAYEKLQNEDFDLVIDVVGLDIYSLGHLPGAVNYVWATGELRDIIPTLDPELTYLVYCHTDPPSTDSAQALVNAGIMNVFRLEGNYRAWTDAGYPIET